MAAGAIGPLPQAPPQAPAARITIPAIDLGPGTNAGRSANDSISSLLREIATPQIADLLLRIEQNRATVDPAIIDALMRDAAQAVRDLNVPRVLANLSEVIALAPDRAESLPAEPAFAPMRGQVVNLVQQVAAATRVTAEQAVTAASHLMETNSPTTHHTEDVHLRSAVALADRLIDSGRQANLVRATELAATVIAYYGPFAVAPSAVPALPNARLDRTSGEAASFRVVEGGIRVVSHCGDLVRAAKAMWGRAPLLLLFSIWIAGGLVAGLVSVAARRLGAAFWTLPFGTGFELWGIGLLALVGFGFYRSTRNLKS